MAGKFTCQPIKNQIEYLKLPKKKLGKGEVKRKEVIGRNQTHNFDFFNVIDTEKAYALGNRWTFNFTRLSGRVYQQRTSLGRTMERFIGFRTQNL
ncbi:hypothetical protein [Microseira wollei]|uniref:hypothetical protein n=1 Tax=Microseira wollei TaxID=467598 RepID=UPI001CFE42AB|nr:hypothetical protein [Microseira wollei]